jgi:FkbM family methyltransferase
MSEEIVEILFNGKVPTKIFAFRREIDPFESDWEGEYVSELIATLKAGMVVYDIGAENGELTVLAGNIVGGENVHIFEPNQDYYPNMAAIWKANKLKEAACCFKGYVFDKSSDTFMFTSLDSWGSKIFKGCLHPNHIDTPMQTISLDDYVFFFPPPDVIMMDIEGGELAAVRGAIGVIGNYSPIFFISIHKP